MAAGVTLAGLKTSNRAAAQEWPEGRTADRVDWQAVPPVDWSTIHVSDFDDQELDVIYLLEHFHTIANSVVERGPERGFIDIHVWRSASQQKTKKVRVMENTLALAYFYTKDEPWNPYYGSQPVRRRLEAALRYWIDLQRPDGFFRADSHPIQTPTAFATKFIGETLQRLDGAPPIDGELLDDVAQAERHAIRAVLEDEDYYDDRRSFTNQYTNVFAGAMAYLALHPDADLAALLREKMQDANEDYQSPAGHFYENDGADFSYDLGTTQSNIQMAWHYARQNERFSDLARLLVKEQKKLIDWLSFNAVPRPLDETVYTLNRAIQARKHNKWISLRGPSGYELPDGHHYHTLLAQEVPQARAFLTDSASVQRQAVARRAALREQWPDPEVPPLNPGRSTAYRPYDFLLREHSRWYPTAAQKRAAVQALPYNQSRRLTHQRTDRGGSPVYTYVRRPGYFAAFNAGNQLAEWQRYGLGLVWHPKMGAVLQSQTSSNHAAWGTKRGAGPTVLEAGDLHPGFWSGDQPFNPQVGTHTISASDPLTVRYESERGLDKALLFEDRQISVQVQGSTDDGTTSTLTEDIPLVVADEGMLQLGEGYATLRQGGATLTVAYASKSGAVEARFTTPDVERVAGRRVKTLRLRATGSLSYRISFGEMRTQGPTRTDLLASVPGPFDLRGNYPNPFRTETTLRVQLPERARISVKVYDVLGRQVGYSPPQWREAGRGEVRLRLETLASGVYVYRLIAETDGNRRIGRGKMVIVK